MEEVQSEQPIKPPTIGVTNVSLLGEAKKGVSVAV